MHSVTLSPPLATPLVGTLTKLARCWCVVIKSAWIVYYMYFSFHLEYLKLCLYQLSSAVRRTQTWYWRCFPLLVRWLNLIHSIHYTRTSIHTLSGIGGFSAPYKRLLSDQSIVCLSQMDCSGQALFKQRLSSWVTQVACPWSISFIQVIVVG